MYKHQRNNLCCCCCLLTCPVPYPPCPLYADHLHGERSNSSRHSTSPAVANKRECIPASSAHVLEWLQDLCHCMLQNEPLPLLECRFRLSCSRNNSGTLSTCYLQLPVGITDGMSAANTADLTAHSMKVVANAQLWYACTITAAEHTSIG